MKAIIEQKIEVIPLTLTGVDVNNRMVKELKITIYFFRMPIFYRHKFIVLP